MRNLVRCCTNRAAQVAGGLLSAAPLVVSGLTITLFSVNPASPAEQSYLVVANSADSLPEGLEADIAEDPARNGRFRGVAMSEAISVTPRSDWPS